VNTTSIVHCLPAQLEWMVLFRLSLMRRWMHDREMKEMFRLPARVDLKRFTHVVLSPEGRFLAPRKGSKLLLPNGSSLEEVGGSRATLLDRCHPLFDNLEINAADCLGFAQQRASAPVLLHMRVKNGEGSAKAVFHREPSRHDYELLRAIGIDYLGGEPGDGGFVALFRNRLRAHLDAASRAGFSRAGNCNRFFFNHGEIDARIASGLMQAAHDRVEGAKRKGLEACQEQAKKASRKTLAMTCQPPPPKNRFPYGDLVPLGFLLHALNCDSTTRVGAVAATLRDKLIAARQGRLWSFHSRRLVTATDSALILHGLRDQKGIEALESFSDGHGAYYPQLRSQTKQPGRMVARPAKAHWCQPDFATTCLVRWLRAEAGLATVTSLGSLDERFETRSGLFFANPYLTDWALAGALSSDPDARQLRHRLGQDILASMNKDYSFGAYDLALSTSFAILALAALGRRGRLLRLMQLRLSEMMDPARGTWPVCTPFYSTTQAAHKPRWAAPSTQWIEVNGAWYELWFYRDTHKIIATSVAVMALAEDCDAQHVERAREDRSEKHPRYGCKTHAEYVAEFALGPYVLGSQSRSVSR
jgi:hypothetical protein